MEKSVQMPTGAGKTRANTNPNAAAASSSSSSPVNLQVPANSNLPLGLPSHLNTVPSEAEAQSAIWELRSFLNSEAGSEFGSGPLMPYPADYRGMQQPSRQITVRAALQLLETDRTFERLVKSIATNEGVWRAISSISEVLDFLRPPETETTSTNSQTPFNSNFYQYQSSDDQQERPQKGKRKSKRGKLIGHIILGIYRVILGETGWKVIEFIMKMVSGKDNSSVESKEEKHSVNGESRRREENQSVDEPKKEKLLLAVTLATVVVLVVMVLRFYVPIV